MNLYVFLLPDYTPVDFFVNDPSSYSMHCLIELTVYGDRAPLEYIFKVEEYMMVIVALYNNEMLCNPSNACIFTNFKLNYFLLYAL